MSANSPSVGDRLNRLVAAHRGSGGARERALEAHAVMAVRSHMSEDTFVTADSQLASGFQGSDLEGTPTNSNSTEPDDESQAHDKPGNRRTDSARRAHSQQPVSYTHLTLPDE